MNRPSPDAVRLAQLLHDGWFSNRGREHDHYPDLVVSLGVDRAGELVEVTYDEVANVLILHVEEDE